MGNTWLLILNPQDDEIKHLYSWQAGLAVSLTQSNIGLGIKVINNQSLVTDPIRTSVEEINTATNPHYPVPSS